MFSEAVAPNLWRFLIVVDYMVTGGCRYRWRSAPLH